MNQSNTIAIDLAKNVFQICVLSSSNKILKEKRLSRAKLPEFMAKQTPSIVTMEACYSSHYWARVFLSMGHTVHMIPAQHVKPFVRGNKNDRNDALAIAEASFRPNIRFVPVKSVEQQDIQSLHRIRDKLVARRTAIVNQSRGLLSEYGVFINESVAEFKKALSVICDPSDQSVSSILKQQLCHTSVEFTQLTKRILEIESELRKYANRVEGCQHLMSIPGIGIINATALFASIGNGSQFSKPKELSVWLGLTPKQFASGDRSFNTGITKRGNHYLRKQLIHGARALIYRVKNKEDKLSIWIKQLIERRGVHKAIVATANRLARIAWLLLHRNEDYKVS